MNSSFNTCNIRHNLLRQDKSIKILGHLISKTGVGSHVFLWVTGQHKDWTIKTMEFFLEQELEQVRQSYVSSLNSGTAQFVVYVHHASKVHTQRLLLLLRTGCLSLHHTPGRPAGGGHFK